MNLLALAVRSAVLAERERLSEPQHRHDLVDPDTLVLRVPPRQPGTPLVWLFTGDRHGVWFRGSFPVGPTSPGLRAPKGQEGLHAGHRTIPRVDARMTRSRGLVVPEARYVGNGKYGISAIDRLHRWKDGANADDAPNRPWNSTELAWYNRVRAENLERREALVARSVEMNGPPARIMPLEEARW